MLADSDGCSSNVIFESPYMDSDFILYTPLILCISREIGSVIRPFHFCRLGSRIAGHDNRRLDDERSIFFLPQLTAEGSDSPDNSNTARKSKIDDFRVV